MTKQSKRTKAIEWMRVHPQVVQFFEEFGHELVSRHRRFGINLIRERVRYECIYRYEGEFKFPNDVPPYVARYLLNQHPDWADYMVCRPTMDEVLEHAGRIQLIAPQEIWADVEKTEENPKNKIDTPPQDN